MSDKHALARKGHEGCITVPKQNRAKKEYTYLS